MTEGETRAHSVPDMNSVLCDGGCGQYLFDLCGTTCDECAGAHTERRLDGYKLFVQTEGENVVIHAVTDGRPVTRLVHELDADTAWQFGQDVCNAARRSAPGSESSVEGQVNL